LTSPACGSNTPPAALCKPWLEYNGVEKKFDEGRIRPTLAENALRARFLHAPQRQAVLPHHPMILTHYLFQPTPDSPDWDPRSAAKTSSATKHFADMTAYMDKLIGQWWRSLKS